MCFLFNSLIKDLIFVIIWKFWKLSPEITIGNCLSQNTTQFHTLLKASTFFNFRYSNFIKLMTLLNLSLLIKNFLLFPHVCTKDSRNQESNKIKKKKKNPLMRKVNINKITKLRFIFNSFLTLVQIDKEHINLKRENMYFSCLFVSAFLHYQNLWSSY